MKKRTVRFYVPVYVGSGGERKILATDFWPEVKARSDALAKTDREFDFYGNKYYGEFGSSSGSFAYFGRIRRRSDFPDGYKTGIGPQGVPFANDPDQQLSERTFGVPFGQENFIALMAPVGTAVSAAAIGRWLTLLLKLDVSDTDVRKKLIDSLQVAHADSSQAAWIELVPVLDKQLAKKLAAAVAASKLMVKVSSEADPGQMGILGDAFREASSTLEDAEIELSLSMGRGSSTSLLRMVKEAAKNPFVKRAKATIVLEKGDGPVREIHDLVKDRVAIQTSVKLQSKQQISQDDAVNAIRGTIDIFRNRYI